MMIMPAPMLASTMKVKVEGAAFDARYSNYIGQEKFDGIRLTIVKSGASLVGWSRGGFERDQIARILPKQIAEALAVVPDCIIDGELRVPGGASWDVGRKGNEDKQVFTAFDVLEVLDEDVTGQPIETRLEFLGQLLSLVDSKAVEIAPTFRPTWSLVQEIWDRGGEGMILKRPGSLYRRGYRSPDWVKVKQEKTMGATITGFDRGKLGPYAVTLVRMDNGVDSRVATLNTETRNEIAKYPASFVGRRLIVQYQQLTPSGNPRHPNWDHLAGEGE
jgi:ATP-dependent DNA ligase